MAPRAPTPVPLGERHGPQTCNTERGDSQVVRAGGTEQAVGPQLGLQRRGLVTPGRLGSVEGRRKKTQKIKTTFLSGRTRD